jgi:hypothetical protein
MKVISFIIVITLIASSCKDFLEEDLSTIVTSESGALGDVTGLTAALAGTYLP